MAPLPRLQKTLRNLIRKTYATGTAHTKKTAPAICVCDMPTEGIASTTSKDAK